MQSPEEAGTRWILPEWLSCGPSIPSSLNPGDWTCFCKIKVVTVPHSISPGCLQTYSWRRPVPKESTFRALMITQRHTWNKAAMFGKRNDLKRSKKTSLWNNLKIKKHDWISLESWDQKARDVHCIALHVVSTKRWKEGWGLCTRKNRANATSPFILLQPLKAISVMTKWDNSLTW